MKKLLTIAFLVCFGCLGAFAQDLVHVNLDANNTGDTVDAPGSGMRLYDDGGPTGNYSHGYDYVLHMKSTCDSSDSATTFLSVILMSYDIGKYDTLYLYDGPDINSPLIAKINNNYQSSDNATFYIGASNTSRMITIRFRAGIVHSDDTVPHFGFILGLDCAKPCESVTGVIDTMYERLDKDGNVVAQSHFVPLPTAFDTIFAQMWVNDSTGGHWEDNLDSIVRIDTLGWTEGALLCMGQSIRFHGHGEYGAQYGYYVASDSTTQFLWTFGTGDTNVGINHNAVVCNNYKAVGCYDVVLQLTDEQGCPSKNFMTVQVRVAQNPIKTIFDLSTICNNDSLQVNVGYEGENGTLTLKKIKFAQVVSKTNEVRTFIPDGPRCEVRCYQAPVTFNEFPNGRLIQSAEDICSICVNYEHSYMGDYSLEITCPTYDQSVSTTSGIAYLKYKNETDAPAGYTPPSGTWGGGGRYTGCPAGDPPDGWDHLNGGGDCDSIYNPFGVGWNYCFSRNAQYTLVSGESCNTATPTDAGLASSGYANAHDFDMPVMVAPFCNAGQDAGVQSVTTKDSSDHAGMVSYYIPADDFSSLVGCPLNGTWNIEICDYWAIDNGWVFNWSMDICNISSAGGCDYQVGIDSVVWRPDTNYATDFYDGIYRGLIINQKRNDSTAAYISSPDTSGDFRIKLSIYDEFGCQWDTLTHISTVTTPLPSLGNDTTICDVQTIPLDATDKFSDENCTYTWEPFGEHTAVIMTTPGTAADHTYIVEVVHSEKNIQCVSRDTVVVHVLPQPVPNFDPGIFPVEGCEPLTIDIVNTTKNGYKYRWVFGDGTYSTLKNPSHSYAAGQYDFKYYVESEGGCKDSLIYPKLVTVFPQPEAQFSWEPTYPTVLHPSIALHNNTTPDNGSNIYRWEIQYDKDNPYSFHTATEQNPSFSWEAPVDEDISGNYTVRLIARTDNYGPSGRPIVCSDTVENTILLINDQIQFPNVVTPNGDGINDRFVIKNLVEGLAYPINQLDIYDKWGSRVFHAENISKGEDFWDPAKTNSPAGSYFYRFVGKGYKGNIEHNGVIEVLK